MRHFLLLFLGLSLTIPLAVRGQEEDDKPEGAKSFYVKGSAKNSLASAQDLDFYKFTLSKGGDLNLTISQKTPPGSNAKSGWQLDLYPESDLANSFYTVTLPETSLSTQFNIGLAAGKYFIKVSSLNSEIAPTKEYTMSSKFDESENYERSPNDSPAKATAIQLNKTYKGNSSSSEDLDFYRFGLLSTDKITVTFSQESPGANVDNGWTLGLYSENSVGTPLQFVDIPSTTKSATLQADLGAGVYYLRVDALSVTTANSDGKEEKVKKAPIGQRYQITVNGNSVPTDPTASCPEQFIYAQNPLTSRWAAFPTICDVPIGWASTTTAPESTEVCPSPHASFSSEKGELSIPLLDTTLVDPSGSKTPLLIYNVKMQLAASQPTLQFNLASYGTVKVIATPASTPATTTPATTTTP